jgi:uncharacterized protein (TIGR03000 family)
MRILGKTGLAQAAVVAAAVVALSASDAMAWSRGGWGSYGGYGGSYGGGSYGGGSYGGYGGSYAGYYGTAGSYGSYGGGGGLFARWHAKKAMRKGYGSYGGYGCYGSYGSSGSSGGYAVSYGSYGGYGCCGSSGSYGGMIYESQPADGYVQPEAPADSAAPGEPTPATPQPGLEATPPAPPSASATEATIWVNLPVDAKVFVNDLPTTSTGAARQYVSRGLERGRTYSYKLRVEFDRDGKAVVEDKLVRLQAGDAVTLAFGGQTALPGASVKTELTLHVPKDASVSLAGAATEQTGEMRTFATTALKNGQHWDDYVVRVELQMDGKTLVEEKTLNIEAGQNYELSFELSGDSIKVASLD